MKWHFRDGAIDCGKPVVMGVVNATPDSFSDGGQFLDPREAGRHAERMTAAGAQLLDVGGESTRPGAEEVSVSEEIRRVIPVIRAIRRSSAIPISIDTRRAEVAEAALAAGADIVNDVSALSDPEMAGVVSTRKAGLVLMHMRGTPATMQENPIYDDVAGDVIDFLRSRIDMAVAAGIDLSHVAIDPGIGFGKTLQHNLELLARLKLFTALDRPVVLGVSRKAFLGSIAGDVAPSERLPGTIAACVLGYAAGVRVFRVHDVLPLRQALDVADAVARAGKTRQEPWGRGPTTRVPRAEG